eukprot:4177141-Pleurochrysis_carterae.AAC.1
MHTCPEWCAERFQTDLSETSHKLSVLHAVPWLADQAHGGVEFPISSSLSKTQTQAYKKPTD